MFILHVAIMLTVTTTTVCVEECGMGWFGENCTMMCHCEMYSKCSKDGVCPLNSRCAFGFFGPGCQYFDLVYNNALMKTEMYLRDADDSSCNPQTSSTSVEVFLDSSLPFLGFNIIVNDKKHMDTFLVTLNDDDSCSNERRFKVHDLEVRVTCDTNIFLNRLLIEGAISPSICSIYINGGRNVALKQLANQSSTTPSNISELFNLAELGVDGNNEQSYSEGSCTFSEIEMNGAEWNLTYNTPCILIRAVIYNLESNMEGLLGFILSTYFENGSRAHIFENNTEIRQIYDLPFMSKIPVMSLMIKAAAMRWHIYTVLSLCEVETYGEIVCPERKYGLNCNRKCKCESTEICDTVTGSCATGCRIGLYGYNCSLNCNLNCMNGLCTNRFGYCIQCNPGYFGKFCTKACPNGTFGRDCLLNCSVHCSGSCNFETGHCGCKDGFVGFQCTECPKGRWGNNCTGRCPPLCTKGICNINTGGCVSCIGGKMGASCTDCPISFYGSKCYTSCSDYCLNKICDKDTGNCSVCTNGYSGRQCRFPPQKPLPWQFFAVPASIPIVVMLLTCYFCMRRRMMVEDTVESKISLSLGMSTVM